MKLEDFTFELPDHLIARHPSPERGDSRLLVATRHNQTLVPHTFKNLQDFLKPGDLLIMNNTRVMQARCFGHKPSGGKIEILIERILDTHRAACLMRGSKRMQPGSSILFGHDVHATLVSKVDGQVILDFSKPVMTVMDTLGVLPIPPYFNRATDTADQKRYQTVYAKHLGAVAAPTAGLHFTPDLLQTLSAQGIQTTHITLHVGAGTFQPVQTDEIDAHIMHQESYHIPQDCVNAVHHCHAQGGRIIAVGTTVVRTIETMLNKYGCWQADQGESQLFIRPGYTFKGIDGIITNFHLPKSTLLMMISAWMGHTFMHEAYRFAIDHDFRFYSYGDAILIL